MADSDSKPITPDEIRALAQDLEDITPLLDRDDPIMRQSATLLRVLAAIAERCADNDDTGADSHFEIGQATERKAIAALITEGTK